MTARTSSTARDRTDRAVLDAYLAAVRRLSPDLAPGGSTDEELRAQARRILQATHARLDPGTTPPALPSRDTVGRQRALDGVPPSRSIKAAGALFRTALPPLCDLYGPEEAERVSLALHQSILDRVAAASVTYFEGVLDRLTSSRLDERLRISRDLHDRTSHGVGAAMQGVDLAMYHLERGEAPDMERLAATRRVLLETLEDVRAMASLLRDACAGRTLREAITEYLDATVPPGRTFEVRELTPAVRQVRGMVAEESYLILREAVRNSVVHARGATRLQVVLGVDSDELVAEVVDDGPGIDLAAAVRGRTVGLASMQERAQALGGSVTVRNGPSGGVTLRLRVPLMSAGASVRGAA